MQHTTIPCLIRPMQEPGVHNKITWSKPEDQEKFVFRIIIHVPKSKVKQKEEKLELIQFNYVFLDVEVFVYMIEMRTVF